METMSETIRSHPTPVKLSSQKYQIEPTSSVSGKYVEVVAPTIDVAPRTEGTLLENHW